MANGARPQSGHFTMTDYVELEKSSLLSKYIVTYDNWRQKNPKTQELEYRKKEFRPFSSFDQTISKAPAWYKAYNEVKHNREEMLI